MNKLGLSLILSCVLAFSLVITGCGCSVAQPIIKIQNGCFISWEPVERASGYEVAVDDYKHETTSQTSFNLIKYLQKGSVSDVRVRALGSGLFHSNSEYSEPVSLTIASTRMPSPENLQVTSKNKTYTLTWDSVLADTDSKISYCIRFVGADEQEQYFQTESSKFEINGKLSGSGEFRVAVFAYVPEVTELAPSEFSEEITFEYLSLIAVPQAVELGANNTLSWAATSSVNGYNVSFIGGDTTFVNTTSVNLDELSDNDSKLSEKCVVFAGVQAVNKSDIQYSSPYSNFVSLYKSSNSNDLSNCKYTYCGDEFDFYVNNFQELERVVHFTLFYRISPMAFCVDPNYTSDPNDIISPNSDRTCAVAKAISSYAEIMNIMYNYSYSLNTKLYTINIEYNHPEYARKISTSDGAYTQNEVVYVAGNQDADAGKQTLKQIDNITGGFIDVALGIFFIILFFVVFWIVVPDFVFVIIVVFVVCEIFHRISHREKCVGDCVCFLRRLHNQFQSRNLALLSLRECARTFIFLGNAEEH